MSTTTERRRYQHRVESLLDDIRRRVDELRRLKAHGVRGGELVERKQELEHTRHELATVVGRQLAA
jgi:hypothetical protein